MGKRDGFCKGKTTPTGVTDISKGIDGSCGIVGGGIPIGVGYGLAFKMQKTKRVALVSFGDGASNTGYFHESLNMAAIWKVNVVFIAENNQYGLATPAKDHLSVKDIAIRAKGYGIPGKVVDGNDVLEVYQVVKEAVNRARNGEGPSLIEAKTYRILGFGPDDIGGYQPKEEIAEWRKR